MRKIILLLMFSLLLGCISEEDAIKTPEPTETPAITEAPEEENSIVWIYDVEEAKGIAEEENKLILIDFNADNCVWCQRLEDTTYKEEGVIKLVNENFVPVFFDLDIEANKEIYVVNYHKYVQGALPTILILNSDAKPLYRIVGYKTGEQLIELLDRALAEVNQ
jgi:thioredoxin-related protein